MHHPIRTLILALMLAAASASAEEIVYPGPEFEGDNRYTDIIRLLEAALEVTEEEYGEARAVPHSFPMSEERYMTELSRDGVIDVGWSSFFRVRERALTPILIPLRKGLMGYRIILAHKDVVGELAEVDDRADLERFIFGQGDNWGDVAVYEHNNLPVVTARYPNLFGMLNYRRFDLFPRAVNEVFREFEHQQDRYPNIVIDERLVLYYPWPYYLYVNENDTELAARLETGLRRLIESGEFDRMFRAAHGDAIKAADLNDRKLIRLDNPWLPMNTPVHDPGLWFRPSRGVSGR